MDSWITDDKGEQLTTNWGGRYSLTRSVVATHKNSFGRAMLSAVDHYMEEMKVDGLYWDEMEGTGYGMPLVTYNAADGFSCEQNPETYTIQRKIGINTIMGEGHRIAVIKRVRELGGDLMGNGPTSTKKILALQPQRMIETQHNDYWNYQGNLQSPLAYAGSRLDFGNWIRALKMATLLVGTRYDYSHEISSHVFPFTPIELHAGYLLGKERIIATHSGNYGWPGTKHLVKVIFFDNNGKKVKRAFPTRIDHEARTKVEVGENEAVVLVKLPIIVISEGLTKIHVAQYGIEGFEFTTEAANKIFIEIQTGEMTINPGQVFNLKIDEKSTMVTANNEGVLKINVEASLDPLKIEVAPR